MEQNETTFDWSFKSEQASRLVAEDKLSDEDIASKVKIGRTTLWRWKDHPDFKERVTSLVEAFRQAVLTEGIADRINRVKRLDTDWKRMQALIEARADETPRDVPGASTGLVVRKEKETKFGTVIEYAADTGLLAELRATEMQAAKELGQWVEKSNIDAISIVSHRFPDLAGLSPEDLIRLHNSEIGDPP
jgi:hypothetical protein